MVQMIWSDYIFGFGKFRFLEESMLNYILRLKFLLVASTIVGFDLILGVLQGIK